MATPPFTDGYTMRCHHIGAAMTRPDVSRPATAQHICKSSTAVRMGLCDRNCNGAVQTDRAISFAPSKQHQATSSKARQKQGFFLTASTSSCAIFVWDPTIPECGRMQVFRSRFAPPQQRLESPLKCDSRGNCCLGKTCVVHHPRSHRLTALTCWG